MPDLEFEAYGTSLNGNNWVLLKAPTLPDVSPASGRPRTEYRLKRMKVKKKKNGGNKNHKKSHVHVAQRFIPIIDPKPDGKLILEQHVPNGSFVYVAEVKFGSNTDVNASTPFEVVNF